MTNYQAIKIAAEKAELINLIIADIENAVSTIDMTVINETLQEITDWKTLNVATGAEGTNVAYDASTNTLTIPRGNTGAQGIQGIQGIQGVKGDTGDALTVTSIINNPDYTLTLNFSDGTSHTTGVLRGIQGEQGIQGIQGFQGEQGIQGEKGDSVTNVTSSKVGKTTTVTVEVENNAPFTFDVLDGADGAGSGDMLSSVYDTNGDGKVDAADSADSVDWSGVQNKPTDYPPSTHNHDSDYAPLVHNHDSDYSPLGHTHDYASSTHNHDTAYLGITAKAADSSKLNGATESTAGTANSIVKRDASGDTTFRLVQSTYQDHATIASTAGLVFRNSTTDNYLRTATPAAVTGYLAAVMPNPTSTTKGAVKVRLNGTTAYITSNGNDA